jgi:uncharacterized protein YecE (DUF72 family)
MSVSMPQYLIGTGGWSYFKIGDLSSLEAYSRVFDFVEVNVTFYQYPSIKMVRAWRRKVSNDFTFSVRCHQDLTHKYGLRPIDEAYNVFYQMATYCRELESPYLVLETPQSYVVNQESALQVRDFFSSLDLKGLRLVWEYRGPFNSAVVGLMKDFNIIQSADLSKQKPAFSLDVTYSRLFGKGQHNLYQFTDEELLEIDAKAKETGSKTIIMSYHGARMNSDAARFKRYKDSGKFLPVSDYSGVYSAQAVLAEDAKFPTTKSALIIDQGWKVFDLTPNKREHLSKVVEKLPEKTYYSLSDVVESLKEVL